MQLGAEHRLCVQTWLEQSLPLLQVCPSAQASQEPPQSTSPSSPFLTPSTQDAGTQSPPAHCML